MHGARQTSAQCFFITGTDTDIGKTYAATCMLQQLAHKRYRTLGLKPVAAGADWHGRRLINDDARALEQAATEQLSYQEVNPFCFAEPIAPHLAAANAGTRLSVDAIASPIRQTIDHHTPDYCLLEGAGGWRVPLNEHEYFSDLAVALNIPVIMIVGIKLGCLNHALLTSEMMQADGVAVAGWLANCLSEPSPLQKRNITTLKQHLPFPCLGRIPYKGELSQSWEMALSEQSTP